MKITGDKIAGVAGSGVAGTNVVIVIPTLLGGEMLDRCLAALDGQTWRDFSVVVVDNGSSAQPEVAPRGFALRVLRPRSNLGYGGALNLAIRSTEAPLIAALNDDTEPEPQWLGELVREMESGERVGMCASSIRLLRSGRMDSAGMNICVDGSSKQRGGSMPAADFGESAEVLFPSACAALYRRELLEEIGLFDDDFFLYCEDTDIGLRAVWAGWRCRYAAGAHVWHGYSSTAQPYSALKARYVERNRMWVALKSFPLPLLLLAPFASGLRYLWQLRQVFAGAGAAAEFVRAEASLRSAFAVLGYAHLETVRHLPALIRKRAAIRRTRKIAAREFIRLILRHRISIRHLARA